MSQSQRRFLRLLRNAGDRGVPASDVPSGCAGILADLETCGAVGHRAAGRGDVVCITNVDAFELFVGCHFPLGLDAAAEDAVDRVAGVRLFGDAKVARRGRWEGVFIRSTKPGTELVSNEGQRLPVAELTALGGGTAIALGGARRWSCRGVVAIIENAEAFWQHDQLLTDVDLAVFSYGRLSERVLAWVASNDMGHCEILHWGDYDPVGCLEYLRLRERCGQRVRMHLPNCVSALLPLYGKADLIRNQVGALATLRRHNADETVATLLRLFDEHRKGMEQEALLIEGSGAATARTGVTMAPHGDATLQGGAGAFVEGSS